MYFTILAQTTEGTQYRGEGASIAEAKASLSRSLHTAIQSLDQTAERNHVAAAKLRQAVTTLDK